jgi:cell division protein FtsQ
VSARSRRLLAAGAALVALGVAGELAWNSSWLKLHTVQVVGIHQTTRQQVLGVAALVPGTRLAAISDAVVARRVEALPWVATATVTHVLPSTLRIAVTERVPAVVVAFSGRSYLVDATGHVMAAGSGPYPQLTGVTATAIVPGAQITGTAFGAALAVLDSLPRAVRGQVAGIAAPSANAVTVTLADRTTIAYGSADQLPSKNADVVGLLGAGRSYASINVMAPDHPAAVPR